MKKLLLIFFCVCFSFSGFSQTWKNYFSGNTIYHIDKLDSILLVGVDNQVVSINIYTGQRDYLMPDAITYGNCVPYRHVAIDSNNTFWIAASSYGNGLFKYKDSLWHQYTSSNSPVPNNSPYYMYMDHYTNTLWIRFSGISGSFDGTNFNSIGNYPGPFIADKNGNLWIAGNMMGLLKYDGNTVVTYNTINSDIPSNNITQVTVDANSKVWFSIEYFDTITFQNSYTIGTFDGSDWFEYSNINSNLPIINNEIVKLEVDTNNTLVIATSNNGLIEFDGINATVYNHSMGNFPDVTISTFLIDRQGNRWIGTEYNGLFEMAATNLTKIPTANNPMPGSKINDVMVDNSGKVWAGIEHIYHSNKSIAIKSDTSWTIYQENNGDQPGSANAICMDNSGNVFVVGQNGLYKYDGSNWQDYNGLGVNPVGKVGMDVDDNGNVWIGVSTVLIKCNGSGTTTYNPPGNFNVQCVTIDEYNNIWVGTNHSINKFDGIGNWVTYDYTNTIPALMSGASGITFDSNGKLWAAGSSLISFDGTSWTSYHNPVANYLTDVSLDGGENKWVSWVNGLARFDGTNWDIFNQTNSPMINEYVYSISIDIDKQTIWGGTYCGGLFSFRDTSLIVGLDNNKLNPMSEYIKIYPNPASDFIRIEVNSVSQEENHIGIVSMDGKLMFKGSFNDSDILLNVSNYPKGIYLVKLFNKEFIKVCKLIRL